MSAMYDKVGEWASVDDSYNWILYWFCGMTEKEVYDIAYASHRKYSAVDTSIETWTSPSGLDSSVGQVSVSWTKGVLAMTISRDGSLLYTNSYNYKSGYAAIPTSDGWTEGQPRWPALWILREISIFAPNFHPCAPLFVSIAPTAKLRTVAEMIRNGLTVKQAIDRYSSNFLQSYSGYHSK